MLTLKSPARILGVRIRTALILAIPLTFLITLWVGSDSRPASSSTTNGIRKVEINTSSSSPEIPVEGSSVDGLKNEHIATLMQRQRDFGQILYSEAELQYFSIPALEFAAQHLTIEDVGYRPKQRHLEPTLPRKRMQGDQDSYYLLPTLVEAEVTSQLPPLRFRTPAEPKVVVDSCYPVISVVPPHNPNGMVINYFFEFDTSPEFNSPNVWRYPMNTHACFDENITSRRAYRYVLFFSALRDVDSTNETVRFPFRVTNMRLPSDWDSLTYEEMAKQGFALGYLQAEAATVREVYEYVRYHYYDTGNDAKVKHPIDVFWSGVGQCGYVNDLAGTFLEFNGIRYRTISGFNPYVRSRLSGAGHTAMEVYQTRTGKWGYVDPFLDIFLPDVPVAEFPRSDRAKRIKIHNVKNEWGGELQEHVGKSVELNELFRYWKMVNPHGRAGNRSVLHLLGHWNEYGMDWEIEGKRDYLPEDVFESTKQIYVRARYILTDGREVRHYNDITNLDDKSEIYLVSPWATTTFIIQPLMILTNSVVKK